MNFEDIKEVITSRKSTYPAQFSGAVIEDQVVWQLLDLICWAPTHRMTQPWKFKVYSGKGLHRMVDTHTDFYLKRTPKEAVNPKKLAKFKVVKENTSHLIAVIMERDELERVPEWEEIAALAMGIQNMYLGMEAAGVGGYWSTGNGTLKPEMKELLDLGERESLLGWFYLGVPKEGLKANRIRKAIEDKVDWISE